MRLAYSIPVTGEGPVDGLVIADPARMQKGRERDGSRDL